MAKKQLQKSARLTVDWAHGESNASPDYREAAAVASKDLDPLDLICDRSLAGPRFRL